MAQTSTTSAIQTFDSKTRDRNEPCTRCGSLAHRSFDDHYECTGCGHVTRKTPGTQTTLDHDFTDEPISATDAEVEHAIEQAETEFNL